MRSRTTWVMLIAAVVVFVVYAEAERAGLREATSLLTRTDALENPSWREALGLAFFLASYALALFVGPVLLIAAVLNEVFARVLGPRRERRQVVDP